MVGVARARPRLRARSRGEDDAARRARPSDANAPRARSGERAGGIVNEGLTVTTRERAGLTMDARDGRSTATTRDSSVTSSPDDGVHERLDA